MESGGDWPTQDILNNTRTFSDCSLTSFRDVLGGTSDDEWARHLSPYSSIWCPGVPKVVWILQTSCYCLNLTLCLLETYWVVPVFPCCRVTKMQRGTQAVHGRKFQVSTSLPDKSRLWSRFWHQHSRPDWSASWWKVHGNRAVPTHVWLGIILLCKCIIILYITAGVYYCI